MLLGKSRKKKYIYSTVLGPLTRGFFTVLYLLKKPRVSGPGTVWTCVQGSTVYSQKCATIPSFKKTNKQTFFSSTSACPLPTYSCYSVYGIQLISFSLAFYSFGYPFSLSDLHTMCSYMSKMDKLITSIIHLLLCVFITPQVEETNLKTKAVWINAE